MPNKTPKARILMIEDEVFLIDIYKKKFEDEGYEIITATEVKSGFDLAKTAHPDLILLDIVLPKVDGYELLKSLKKHPKTKSLPIMVFSNLGQKGEIAKGLRLGADEYVVKSNLTPTALVGKVEKMLNKFRKDAKGKIPFPEPPRTKATPRILLIEDDEIIIDMYRLKLEREGFEVEVARNGAWGLRLAQEKTFRVILMDMVMPALDGYETLKTLKKNPKTKEVPVIILSNSAQESEIKKAKKLGAAAYFVKSQTTPQGVVEKVKEVITKKER